ncbi:GNAT family N-acetyltransferase [Amycolatopsis sp. NPDC059027]|uniref:GNAT family N-acetyltransferase n=1 Tax=Amycolatopsis sp. NPDC059027 TaxID=3346709 RepID=UPI00366A87B1
MIEIREAGPDDGDVLGEIHTAAWKVAYAPSFDPEFAEQALRSRRGRWHARIAEGAGTLLLGALDGRPMALSYSLPSSERPGFAEISSFYGHPDGWGSGIAAALMTETLRRLSDDGFAQVHLWTWRDTPQSRRFYRKCGFSESGETRLFDYGAGNLIDQVEYSRAC